MMFRRKSMRAKVLPLGAMGIRAWPEQNFLFEILMSMQEGENGYTIILYSCVELTISIVHGTRQIPVLHFIHMLFTILHQICLIYVRS